MSGEVAPLTSDFVPGRKDGDLTAPAQTQVASADI